MKKSFAKTLTANDVGETGTHQAGICVPKKNQELLSFFPKLDLKIKNPDCLISCLDESGESWKLRFVYYNGKTLAINTRDEYRITRLSSFFSRYNVVAGEILIFTKIESEKKLLLTIKKNQFSIDNKCMKNDNKIVKLRGWRRLH
jgi:hypothetical protein